MAIERLLIIGNGFDKWCGLNSSFGDYFHHRLKSQKSYFSQVYEAIQDRNDDPLFSFNSINKALAEIKKGKFSIWDMFFLVSSINVDSVNWYDIENLIYKSLIKRDYGNEGNKTYWDMIFGIYYTYKGSKNPPLSFDINLMFLYLSIVSFDQKDYYVFLKEELLKFEKQFARYLSMQVSDNSYIDKHKVLVKKLTSEVPNPLFNSSNVLSFNYTQVQLTDNVSLVENVHGLIDKDLDKCIIGIDSQKDNVFDSNTYKFTKTYRKLERYVFQDDKNIANVLDVNIRTISFFGHSLNQQDYSYFQSIFDFYGIYDKCTLIFYYTVYKPEMETKIKDDYVKAVSDLLISYGNSMDNKDKGRNLLHKLIIESRVIIRRIPTYKELTSLN